MKNKMDGPGRSKKKLIKREGMRRVGGLKGSADFIKAAQKRKQADRAKTNASNMVKKASERSNTLKNLKPPM